MAFVWAGFTISGGRTAMEGRVPPCSSIRDARVPFSFAPPLPCCRPPQPPPAAARPGRHRPRPPSCPRGAAAARSLPTAATVPASRTRRPPASAPRSSLRQRPPPAAPTPRPSLPPPAAPVHEEPTPAAPAPGSAWRSCARPPRPPSTPLVGARCAATNPAVDVSNPNHRSAPAATVRMSKKVKQFTKGLAKRASYVMRKEDLVFKGTSSSSSRRRALLEHVPELQGQTDESEDGVETEEGRHVGNVDDEVETEEGRQVGDDDEVETEEGRQVGDDDEVETEEAETGWGCHDTGLGWIVVSLAQVVEGK
eukprot:XP_020395589.1 neural Wiskott-Aldrich syndrome protein-like [Zea mays]